MRVMSGTLIIGGVPEILQPLYNPALLPCVQVLSGFQYPARLGYSIQQPSMAIYALLIRYIKTSQTKMHKMMQHRWEVTRE